MAIEDARIRGTRRAKIVEWSEEDQCYVSRSPRLICAVCHGEDKKAMLEEFCLIVEEAIDLRRADGKPLPPSTSGKDFANQMQRVA